MLLREARTMLVKKGKHVFFSPQRHGRASRGGIGFLSREAHPCLLKMKKRVFLLRGTIIPLVDAHVHFSERQVRPLK